MPDAQLTAQERHELLRVLRDLDPGAPKESRQHPRRKVLMHMELRRIVKNALGPITRVVVMNVSRVGVGFISKTPIAKGQHFVVRFRFAEGGGWLLLCEVRNTAPLANSQTKVGAKFIDRLEDDTGRSSVPADWLVGAPK